MRESIYYAGNFRRSKSVKGINELILLLISYPKLVLDAFLRRDMGERYFPYLSPVVMFFILYYLPATVFRMYNWGYTSSYYMFLVAYAIMTVWRWVEIYRAPSVYDFARFSLDTGKPWPFFYKIALPGKRARLRTIELYYEPLFCFLIGFAFLAMYQFALGIVIVVCSIAYFLGSHLAAKVGQDFMLDKIDEIIVNQDVTNTFLKDEDVSPRGVPFHSRKPNSEELRGEFLNYILEDDDLPEAR